MILSLYSLLFIILLGNAAKSEILSASDVRICTNLCSSCGGESTFEKAICDCRVADGDEKSAECLKHLIKHKRQTENLIVDSISSDQEIANRETRCSLLKGRDRLHKGDAKRIANYFARGGPLAGKSLLGSPKEDCNPAPKESTNSVEGVTEKDVDIGSPLNTNSESNTAEENKPAIDSNAGSTVQYQSGIVGSPLPLRNFYPHQGLLGAIPNLLLGIPQALARAAVPGLVGMQHPSMLGAPQPAQFFGSSQMLGSVPTFVPATGQGNMVITQPTQLMNPVVGIPNAVVTGAQAPTYYPAVFGTMHYSPVVGAVAPQAAAESADNNKKQPEEKPLSEEKSPQPEEKPSEPEDSASSESSEESVEKPSQLRATLARQNSILQSLSQQLQSYTPQIGIPRYPYRPIPYGIVAAPNPIQTCQCKQGLPVLGSPNPSAIQSPDTPPRPAVPLEKTVAKLGKSSSKSGKEKKKDDKAILGSKQSATEKEKCDWKCVPKGSTKSRRDSPEKIE